MTTNINDSSSDIDNNKVFTDSSPITNHQQLLLHSSPDLDKLRQECHANISVIKDLCKQFPNINETCVIRFLIVNHNDPIETALKLNKMCIWRQITFPMLAVPFSKGSNVCYTHGYDKLGHPLLFFIPGLNDPNVRIMDEMMRWLIYMMEVALKRVPKHLLQITVVVDRSKRPINVDYELIRCISKIVEEYYPCLLYRIYICPVGYIFRGVWCVLKNMVASRASKIIRPVSNYEGLKQIISDEYIPVRMGGKCNYTFNVHDFPSPFVENYAYSNSHLLDQENVDDGNVNADMNIQNFPPDDLYIDETNDYESINQRINQPSMSIYHLNFMVNNHNNQNNLDDQNS